MTENNVVVTKFPNTPTRDELLSDDESRIAKLTTDAIKASGDRAARDVMAAVAELDGIMKIIRDDAEQLSDEIRRHTEAHAQRVGRVIEDLRELSLVMRDKRDAIAKTGGSSVLPPRAAE
jgi:hypothetical protein